MALKKDLIYSRLLGDIRSGLLPVGTKLPPEIELAAAYQVGRITLRAALAQLEREGLLLRVPRRGTIVISDQEPQWSRSVMILYHVDNSITSYSYYLTPELISYLKECDCRPVMVDSQMFELCSLAEIQRNIEREHIIGIIVLDNNFNGDEKILTTLRALKLPVVTALSTTRDPERTGFPGVGVNEKEGTELALCYIAGKKIRSIAFLGDSYLADFRGLEVPELAHLAAQNNLFTCPEWFFPTGFDQGKIEAAAAQLLTAPRRPEMILCYSSFYAFYLYGYLRSHQFSVPEDISVMGICGYLGTRFLSPELTSLNYNYDRIAVKTVQELLQPHAIQSGIFYECKATISEGESIRCCL